MVLHRWTLIVLLGVVGMALLITAAWIALYAISRMPRGAADHAISPGEWKAWTGLGFMVVAIVYFLSHVQVFAHGGPWNNPEANRIGRNLVMLLIAWTVLSSVLKSRWQGAIEEDERDRQIEAQAQYWGYGAISVYVIGLAVLLGFSPAQKLDWSTHFMIGNLLVLSLMWACLFEYAVKVGLYWRDRR